MNNVFSIQTSSVAFACTLLVSGLALADRPPLEALESLTHDLANAPTTAVVPPVVAPAPVAETAVVAPAIRSMAPVAADRIENKSRATETIEAAPATSATTLSELRKQEAKQTTASTVGGNSLNGWIAIGLVLMVMGAVATWLKRKGKPTGLPSAEDITPLAVTRLWGKHSIGLVRVSGRILVVGLGETGMNLLTELEEAELPSPVPSADASEREQRDFTASLMNRFQSNNKSSANDPFGALIGSSSERPAEQVGSRQIQLTPLKRPTQPGPAEELLGLSEERAAIRRRLDALRQRNLRVA